jgi:UDP-N-acetylglucosamine pyrophosphorylase
MVQSHYTGTAVKGNVFTGINVLLHHSRLADDSTSIDINNDTRDDIAMYCSKS